MKAVLERLEADVRERKKSLVVLRARSEIKADAMDEEATKKTPAAASCRRCVRIATWRSKLGTEATQVRDLQHSAVKRVGARR
jgi:hypothetical protein